MRRAGKRAGIALFCVLLSACGEPSRTAEYYMAHPDEMKAQLASCQGTGLNTFNCNEAAKAEALLKRK